MSWAGPVFSAVLYVLCFPKFNLGGWLGWFALVPWFFGVADERPRRAFRRSAVAGFLAHVGILYWVYPTCRWGSVGPAVSALALAALAAYLCLYWGVFGAMVSVGPRASGARPFYIAAAWVVCEELRSRLFSGFPWLPFASSQWLVPKHLSLAAWGGAASVSFLLVLFNAVLFETAMALRRRDRRAFKVLAPAVSVLISLTALGVWLWRRPFPMEGAPVAVVQGNIDQYKKWDEAYEAEIVDAYSGLTRKAAVGAPRLLVWPETAVPGWIPNDRKYLEWASRLARESGAYLLFGAVSRQENLDFNAAFLLAPTGELVGQYRKQHLVPFGEYAPFRSVLGKLSGVLNALGAFDAGREASVLRGPVRLGVSICYEGLFPSLVREFARGGAEVLINITNDGWYRDTAGPEQHFAANVLRAVENRRWLLRAANTGISGVVNPRGEIVGRTRLLEPAVLSASVPPMSERSLYVRWGDWFIGVCAVLLLGFAVASAGKPYRPPE